MARAKSFEEFAIRVLKGQEHRFTSEASQDDSTIADVVKAAYAHALRNFAVAKESRHAVVVALLWAGSRPNAEPLLIVECAKTIDALKGKETIKKSYMATDDAIEADRFATLWAATSGGVKNGKVTLPSRNLAYRVNRQKP